MRRTIIAVIMAAVVMIAAVVPVGAEDLYSTYEYIAQDYFGIIYLSKTPLYIYPFDRSNPVADSTFIGVKSDNNQPIIVLIPEEINGTINYQIYVTYSDIAYSLSYDITTRETAKKEASVLFYRGSSALLFSNYAVQFDIDLTNYGKWTNVSTYYTITANHNINRYFSDSVPTNAISSNMVTVDTNLSLDTLIQDSGLTTDDIEQAIINSLESTTNTIITNQEDVIDLLQTQNNYITTVNQNLVTIQNNQNTTNQTLSFIQTTLNNIYTYGNTYEVPQGGADLASSQEKLSGAEKAISDKSTSLKDSVSSQWSGNKTTAINFISTITPATAAVTTVLADITAVMPAELQAALVAIPMIIFIGWLIGRLD